MSTLFAAVPLAFRNPYKLEKLYKKILFLSEKLPKDAAYKVNLEAIICHRLSIVKEAMGNGEVIEDKIGCGSLKMLIAQAEDEYELVQKMILFEAWEPLIEPPPPGQWLWPPPV